MLKAVMSITPTIQEPFDTQMLDFSGDIDVHMQPASSDPWTHTEAQMEDDVIQHNLHTHTTPFSEHESVEIEMEAYDDGNQEYEMADEAGPYSELVDVEVYDASQVHTPLIIPADVSTPVAVSPELAVPVFLSAPSTPNISATSNLEQSEAPSPQTLAMPNSALPVPPTEESESVTLLADAAGNNEDEERSLHLGETVVEPEPTLGITLPNDSVHVENSILHPGATPVVTEAPLPAVESHPEDASEGVASHHDEPQQHDSHTPVDPHEISEGVYIDPPPPVLLSVHSDQPEISLFNIPGSDSPLPEGQPSPEGLILLLPHRPTLYYEPLSNVFHALRQEEYINALPDIANGEMILDAYDLQLVVSEDNVFAREVTLHDLNVLHDGSDLAGPLRIHLHISTPRFILRYHSLQEQVTRLNLAVEASEEYSEGYDAGQESVQDILHNHQEVQESHAETSHVEENNNHVDEQEQLNPEDSAESARDEGDKTAGELASFTTEEPEYHEIHGEAAHTLEEDNEYANIDSTAEQPEEPPDADAAHETDDLAYSTPDDNGQTEYEGYVGSLDDDEQYGEELSEEAGPHEPAEVAEEFESDAVEHDHGVSDSLLDSTETGEEAVGTENSDKSNLNTQGTPESESMTPNPVATNAEASNDDESAASLENSVEQDDHASVSETVSYEKLVDDPEDEEWDDSLDGEGEIDPSWIPEQDAVSNQSSVTLSSSASVSSKRGYDEVEPDEDEGGGVPPLNSPDSKRARVQ